MWEQIYQYKKKRSQKFEVASKPRKSIYIDCIDVCSVCVRLSTLSTNDIWKDFFSMVRLQAVFKKISHCFILNKKQWSFLLWVYFNNRGHKMRIKNNGRIVTILWLFGGWNSMTESNKPIVSATITESLCSCLVTDAKLQSILKSAQTKILSYSSSKCLVISGRSTGID